MLGDTIVPKDISCNRCERAMNILLTGGAGYIGGHTALVLAQMGHRVILYDNLYNSTEAVVDLINTIAMHDCVFVRGDVRETGLLKAMFQTHQIDAVIHLASLKAVREPVQEPVSYYANNVHGTFSLLQAMKAENIKTLVFRSSATVYGEPQYLPIDEAHPTSATNPYGRSKLHIEEMLADVASLDAGWHIACLRYFNPVGSYETDLLGEEPTGRPNNLVPLVAQIAVGRRSVLSVFGDDYATPDGMGVRNYIHVMDIAEGHALSLQFLLANAGWHAINLGAGRAHSVLKVVNSL